MKQQLTQQRSRPESRHHRRGLPQPLPKHANHMVPRKPTQSTQCGRYTDVTCSKVHSKEFSLTGLVKLQVAINVTQHRITEWSWLEGSSEDHLVYKMITNTCRAFDLCGWNRLCEIQRLWVNSILSVLGLSSPFTALQKKKMKRQIEQLDNKAPEWIKS